MPPECDALLGGLGGEVGVCLLAVQVIVLMDLRNWASATAYSSVPMAMIASSWGQTTLRSAPR